MFEDWLSIIINLLLLLVTISTVVFASKTLLMEHSSQVIVSRIRFRRSNKEYFPYCWEVEVNNVGNGYIIKAFILLEIPSKKSKWRKQYFLSKPIIGLTPNDNRLMSLTLAKHHVSKADLTGSNGKVEVIYQDALNNMYRVEPGMQLNKNINKHLETFDNLPKRMNKFSLRYRNYKRKMKKAIKQKHSYPHRSSYENQKFLKEVDYMLKSVEFEPVSLEDIKSKH